MPVQLHAATVRAYLQGLASAVRLVDIAQTHCRDHDLPDAALTEARLADDMWPFAKQVSECVHHSIGAIIGVREGVFRPQPDPVASDFGSIMAEVTHAIKQLEAIGPNEMEDLAARPLRFEFGTYRVDYVGEDFLMSFSNPNFYFHLTAAYAILRAKGLPVGKRDYLGRQRTVARG